MDFIRFRYQGTMRSADGQTFAVQWGWTNPGAKVLNIPTAFRSGRFSYYPLDDGSVGEIPDPTPPRSKLVLPLWMVGAHHCGTDAQWRFGWPPGTPTPPLRPDGWPVCCAPGEPGPIPIGPALGGFALGGFSRAPSIYLGAALGGVELGGETPVPNLILPESLGGVELGGETPVPSLILAESLGGVELGGLAGPITLSASGMASGASTVSGGGASTVAAAAIAVATSTAEAIGLQVLQAIGSAGGTAAVAGDGASTAAAAGSAAATATATAGGASTVASAGSATAIASIDGRSPVTLTGAGNADGVASAIGFKNVITTGAGAADGASSANAFKNVITTGAGSADGTSSALAAGEQATTSATLVQFISGTNNNVADTSAVTWGAPTTAGNILVATLFVSPPTTWTPPAGWTLDVSLDPGSGVGRVSIYHLRNAPSHSGGEAFVPALTTSTWVIHLEEFSGVSQISAFDVAASNSSTVGSGTIDGGTTGTTHQRFELALCAFMNLSVSTLSATPPGWTLTNSLLAKGSLFQTWAYRIDLSAIGTVHFTCTVTPTAKWVADTVCWKLA